MAPTHPRTQSRIDALSAPSAVARAEAPESLSPQALRLLDDFAPQERLDIMLCGPRAPARVPQHANMFEHLYGWDRETARAARGAVLDEVQGELDYFHGELAGELEQAGGDAMPQHRAS